MRNLRGQRRVLADGLVEYYSFVPNPSSDPEPRQQQESAMGPSPIEGGKRVQRLS